jgi:hypothetical protein
MRIPDESVDAIPHHDKRSAIIADDMPVSISANQLELADTAPAAEPPSRRLRGT